MCSTVYYLLIPSSAFASVWTIEPDECLVSAVNQYCETQIVFTLNDGIQEDVCIFENTELIACFTPKISQIVIARRIDKTLEFSLLDKNQTLLASKNVRLTLIQNRPKRRRVKLPWSIF